LPVPAVPDACTRADDSTSQTRIFKIDPGEAAKADEWIEALGRRWGKDQRTIFGARLCVAELFANVIEHGIARSDRDHVVVTLKERSDGIGIEVLDTCAPFNPIERAPAVQARSLESVDVSGRGLTLVRAYAKERAYRHDGTYNRVSLAIVSG
jgi:anti-sigma regulatory factor (Ser/Thr protein kinase)